MRRIRFIVHFPFPDAAMRAEIWRRILPDAPWVGAIDPQRLAQLQVSGGSIRNIALNAAFRSAEAGAPLSMSHLLEAARMEYQKNNQPLTGAEIRGWTRG